MSQFLRPKPKVSRSVDLTAFFQRNETLQQKKQNCIRQGQQAKLDAEDITSDEHQRLRWYREPPAIVRASSKETRFWDDGGRLLTTPQLPVVEPPAPPPPETHDTEDHTAAFLQRNAPTKPAPPPPPRDPLTFSPDDGFYEFIDRQDEAIAKKRELQEPEGSQLVQYTTPRSQKVIGTLKPRPARECCHLAQFGEKISFQADRSATAKFDPTGMKLHFIESHTWMRDSHRQKERDKGEERAREGCTFRPNLGSRKRLNEFAGRAKKRARARAKSPRVEKVEEPEVDVEKLLREQRRENEKKRTGREFKVPFKRATYTAVDLLIGSNGTS
jgi:hypothetical protein